MKKALLMQKKAKAKKCHTPDKMPCLLSQISSAPAADIRGVTPGKPRKSARTKAERWFNGKDIGFTLMELMIVVVIIAIFAAIAAPTVQRVTYRNTLTGMVNDIQRMGALARGLAMKTRHAAVLEVRPKKIWVNLLQGNDCWSDIEQRCMHNEGGGAKDIINFDNEAFKDAKTALCKASYIPINNNLGACNNPVPFDATQGFALCYSGDGVLHVREEVDVQVTCTGAAPTATSTAWIETCSQQDPFLNINVGDFSEGAVIMVNRYVGNCNSEKLDVDRQIHFPVTGAVFSKVRPN